MMIAWICYNKQGMILFDIDELATPCFMNYL